MPRKTAVGVVTSDRMNKTRRVEIPRLVKHPKYKKYVRRRTICYVHDENNESHLGDTVQIVESRPRSRTKRWELVRVVARATMVDVATLRARRRDEQAEQAELDEVEQGEQAQSDQANEASKTDETNQPEENSEQA